MDVLTPPPLPSYTYQQLKKAVIEIKGSSST